MIASRPSSSSSILLEGLRQQLELLDRGVLVEAAIDVVDLHPRLDQSRGHPVGTGVGVLVHELAGVGDQRDVEGVGDLRSQLHAEQARQVVDDLRRARGFDVDQVDRAEAGVVVVVIDVDHLGAVRPEEVDRHPVDVPAVQEDHDPIVDVGRRLVEDLLERQEAVLDRQRELLRRQEHHRVLAERLEDPVGGEQRAERVAVGVLVGGQQEPVALRGFPLRRGRGRWSRASVSVIRPRAGG